ncbi:hypothetical protein LINPERHAP2_LOCUS21043 [Linum perenne]
MERMVPRPHLSVPGPWTRLWGMEMPPRVKCFLWRVARGVLPTRRALQYRHIAVPYECRVCGEGWENDWHLFLQCHFSQRC